MFQFVVIHTVKGFCVVNEAEVDIFLACCCFFYDPTDGGNLISGSSAFSIPSLYIWNFLVMCVCVCVCVCVYLLFFGFPSYLGHHRALNRVPCTIQ